MDTKFSVAVHSLILISESAESVTSEEIAFSVGTNPTYIRKVLTLLKKAGVIESRRGVRGFRLCANAGELSLYRIFCAVSEEKGVQIFDIHQNPNDRCIVGRHIKTVLEDTYADFQEQLIGTMKQRTLADCISEIRSLETLAQEQKRSETT